MAGREGRTSALGIPPERISQKTYTSKKTAGERALLWGLADVHKSSDLCRCFFYCLPCGRQSCAYPPFPPVPAF